MNLVASAAFLARFVYLAWEHEPGWWWLGLCWTVFTALFLYNGLALRARRNRRAAATLRQREKYD